MIGSVIAWLAKVPGWLKAGAVAAVTMAFVVWRAYAEGRQRQREIDALDEMNAREEARRELDDIEAEADEIREAADREAETEIKAAEEQEREAIANPPATEDEARAELERMRAEDERWDREHS